MKKSHLQHVVVLILTIAMSITAFAHPGRLDKNGGHNKTSDDTYHYHRGDDRTIEYSTPQNNYVETPQTSTDPTPSTTEPVKKSISKYYEEFPTVPNIGYIANIEPIGKTEKDGVYVYQYDIHKITDEHALEFLNALKVVGFVNMAQVDDTHFTFDNGKILILYGETETVCSLTIGYLPTDKKTIDEYYKEFPEVPNLGYILGSEPIDVYQDDEICVYKYDLSKLDEDKAYQVGLEWGKKFAEAGFSNYESLEDSMAIWGKGLLILYSSNDDILSVTIGKMSTEETKKTGDIIGDVLNTDIIAYINNNPVPSYNINNKTVIVAEDLMNYGFTVKWNGTEKSLKISLDKDLSKKTISPLPVTKNTAKVGTKQFSYLYTDIVTYVNGKKVESYNINGKTIIYFDDLKDFGKLTWESKERTVKINIEGLPSDK